MAGEGRRESGRGEGGAGRAEARRRGRPPAARGARSAAGAAVLAATFLAPVPAPAQQPSAEVRAQVDSLLLFTELPSFVATVEPAFEDHFLRLSTSLETLERVRRAAAAAFADSLLYRDVADALAAEADPARLSPLLSWLEGGAAGEVRAITDTTPLPQSFEAFVAELEETPPEPGRLALVRRWAEARGAGEFVLLLDEAQREAAHRVAAAVDADAPPFEPIGDRAFALAHAQVTAYSVLSFLHRLQPVPDATLEAAVAEYESEAGQWFVEAYALALASAIREASRRVVSAVGSPAP